MDWCSKKLSGHRLGVVVQSAISPSIDAVYYEPRLFAYYGAAYISYTFTQYMVCR